MLSIDISDKDKVAEKTAGKKQRSTRASRKIGVHCTITWQTPARSIRQPAGTSKCLRKVCLYSICVQKFKLAADNSTL
jgi:hypothetical protein